MPVPTPPASHNPSPDYDVADVAEEIAWLAGLADHRFREEVGNYLRRPYPVTRAALRDPQLASRTYEALQALFQTTESKINVETSGEVLRRLARFRGLVTAERKAVLPYATQAVLLTTTKGPVYEALLRLMGENEPRFQELLREVKRERKNRGRKPQLGRAARR